MATRIIDDSKLNDIAVAIQTKDSGGQMTVDDMPDRIDALPTGGTLIPKTIIENGVYNAVDDNADGYDVVTVDVPEKNTFDEYFSDTLVVANIPSAIIIADRFFYGKTHLIDVIMPNVTRIGQSSFQNCINLALTSLPSGLTVIAQHGFDGCTNLALTGLPSGITSIIQYTFQNCTNLALTSLPSGVTSIGVCAFQNCTNLALTSLPSSVTSIGGHAFQGCTNLALTGLPSGVTSIGMQAFAFCVGILYLDFSEFTQIPTLGSGAFGATTFPLYFRDQQQIDEWAAATNWSTYADRFQLKPSGVI